MPGQLVKFVAVGFETMVQPLITASADADVVVERTAGTVSIPATSTTEPAKRTSHRTTMPSPTRCGRDCNHASWLLLARRKVMRPSEEECPLAGASWGGLAGRKHHGPGPALPGWSQVSQTL
jgi:hypothetical protein